MSRWNPEITREAVAAWSDLQIMEFPGHSAYYELSDDELILFEAEVMRRGIYTADQMRGWQPRLYERIAEEAAALK